MRSEHRYRVRPAYHRSLLAFAIRTLGILFEGFSGLVERSKNLFNRAVYLVESYAAYLRDMFMVYLYIYQTKLQSFLRQYVFNTTHWNMAV